MWHYRLITPDGMHLHPLPDATTVADYDRRGRIVAALNARYQVPEDWVTSQAGYDVAVIEGDLHRDLLDTATMHTEDDTPTGEEAPRERRRR